MGTGKPLSGIERIIALARQAVGTIVDVEKDRIPGLLTVRDQRTDIALVQDDTRILQASR